MRGKECLFPYRTEKKNGRVPSVAAEVHGMPEYKKKKGIKVSRGRQVSGRPAAGKPAAQQAEPSPKKAAAVLAIPTETADAIRDKKLLR